MWAIPSMIFNRTKFIYCDHGALINQINERAITIIRFLTSLFADKTVVLTDKTRNDYIKYFHISPKRVLTIHNWIDDRVTENAAPCNLYAKRCFAWGDSARKRDMTLWSRRQKIFVRPPGLAMARVRNGRDLRRHKGSCRKGGS